MTGLRGRSARAVPSVLLALFCAVLAAFPARPGTDPAVGTSASLTVHHSDAAVVASRGASPLTRHQDTPAIEVADPQSATPDASVAAGPPGQDVAPVAGVALPDVRAPPAATS